MVTHDGAVSPGGVWAAVPARAEALAQTELQGQCHTSQAAGVPGAPLVPGEMASCPAGAVFPSERVAEGREQAVQH